MIRFDAKALALSRRIGIAYNGFEFFPLDV